MARRGWLAGATVLNNKDLANALAPLVRIVVGRLCLNDHDPFPDIRGDTSDIALGRAWYQRGDPSYPLHNYIASLDRRVIIQGVSEQNHRRDGYFYLGFMQAADADGRKACIFNDSVGNPDLAEPTPGWFVSATWQHRLDSGCLTYAKAHGHYVGYHGYGAPGRKLGSAPGDDAAWTWYGGRVLSAYTLLPPEARPGIIFTEAGTFEANFMGPDFTVRDMQGYQQRTGDVPEIELVDYWTAGGRGDPKFDRSCLDPALGAIAVALRAMK